MRKSAFSKAQAGPAHYITRPNESLLGQKQIGNSFRLPAFSLPFAFFAPWREVLSSINLKILGLLHSALVLCFPLFFLVFFLLPRVDLFPLPPQKILQSDDWAYDALATLSREQGKVFFADSRITVAEMQRYLANIDANTLSPSGLDIYDRLSSYLNSEPWIKFQSDAVSLGLDLALQPELYYKTNDNVPWIYDKYSRNPIFEAPAGFSFGPWITAEMDLYIGQNEYAATLNNNYSNIPLDPVAQMDIHIPKRAYVSAGVPVGEASGFNFAIGLGDNFFGRTQTGSIIISEYLERTVYAQASIYSPYFKYTAQVLQYNVNKYHYMHYLQVRPHRTVSVSIAEGVMVNAPLELRFLNPFTIFHSYESYKTYTDYNEDLGHVQSDVPLEDQWNNGDLIYDPNGDSRIGSYFGAKVEWQPIRYFRFYGLLVFDVYDLPMKKQHWMAGLFPDAVGFQAGTDFSFPVQGGYWEFGLEGVYTYPYLYIMWDKGWSFYKEVPELDVMKNPPLRYWTGTPFGPDSIAGSVKAGFRSMSGWYAGFSFVFSAQGALSDLSIFDTDESLYNTYRPSHVVYDVTVPPTGIPVFTYTASLRGEYKPREWLSFSMQPGYRVVVNTNHVEGSIDQGFELALSLRLKPPVN